MGDVQQLQQYPKGYKPQGSKPKAKKPKGPVAIGVNVKQLKEDRLRRAKMLKSAQSAITQLAGALAQMRKSYLFVVGALLCLQVVAAVPAPLLVGIEPNPGPRNRPTMGMTIPDKAYQQALKKGGLQYKQTGMSIASTMRTSRSKRPTVYSGREQLFQVGIENDGDFHQVAVVPIQPGRVLCVTPSGLKYPFPMASQLASFHEEVELDSMTLEYRPSCGENIAGLIYLAVSYDANADTIDEFDSADAMQDYDGAVSGNVYKPFKLTVDCRAANNGKRHLTRNQTFGSLNANSASGSTVPSDYDFGYIVVATTAGATTQVTGQLLVTYQWSFYKMRFLAPIIPWAEIVSGGTINGTNWFGATPATTNDGTGMVVGSSGNTLLVTGPGYATIELYETLGTGTGSGPTITALSGAVVGEYVTSASATSGTAWASVFIDAIQAVFTLAHSAAASITDARAVVSTISKGLYENGFLVQPLDQIKARNPNRRFNDDKSVVNDWGKVIRELKPPKISATKAANYAAQVASSAEKASLDEIKEGDNSTDFVSVEQPTPRNSIAGAAAAAVPQGAAAGIGMLRFTRPPERKTQ